MHNEILKTFICPYLETDLYSAKVVKNISQEKNQLTVTLALGFPNYSYGEKLISSLRAHFQQHAPQITLNIIIETDIIPHAIPSNIALIAHIKNIIAVASGKGGVGKSTTAVNLALALSAEGAKVAILDADIYGPNQPHMLGSRVKPLSSDGKHMQPVISHGLQSMSIGYLVDVETPMIWRGPMVSSALMQLLNETLWQDVDYLIIDLPPGTGDIQLTLAQKIPVTAAVIVTTPQDIALLDARKAVKMFEKVNVPVLGLIENMSIYHCPQCQHAEAIFGEGGGERLATDYHIPFLGALPLNKQIRVLADSGIPTVVAEPESAVALLYRDIALKLAAKLSLQPKSYASKFPKITIEKN
jgi:ATP-binding protein involved in chromosome partitioning